MLDHIDYKTENSSKGHRFNPERKLVPNNKDSGISQNQFLSKFKKLFKRSAGKTNMR